MVFSEERDIGIGMSDVPVVELEDVLLNVEFGFFWGTAQLLGAQGSLVVEGGGYPRDMFSAHQGLAGLCPTENMGDLHLLTSWKGWKG